MLFAYPIQVAAENWLHDSVVAAVERIHALVDDGKRLPAWPNILPEVYREKLASRGGLDTRLKSYAKALRKLTVAERKQTLDALAAQNRIPELLRRECDCEEVAQLPAGIREPALSLFTFVFSLLGEYDVRQRQYAELCRLKPVRVCPFCGFERLDAPGAPQEDLDHYIPRAKYPFAAANLRNLAPMGSRCNKAYKRTQDPLRRQDGQRRRACDPYSGAGVGVSLDNSIVDEESAGPVLPQWAIEFDPTNEAIETWDELFHVRERWARDVLDEFMFQQWLSDFKGFCRTAGLQPVEAADIAAAVRRYEQDVALVGFRDVAFLKAAVFRFLEHRCLTGCKRLLPILRDLVGAQQPVLEPAP